MSELLEFRLAEAEAASLLEPNEGMRSRTGIARVIRTSSGSALFDKLAKLERARLAKGAPPIVLSWRRIRSFSAHELAAANVLQFAIARVIEPDGESCGTRYDHRAACQYCGVNRMQTSVLRLDNASLSIDADICKTLANDELICSERFRAMWEAEDLRGISFRPVEGAGGAAISTHYQLVFTSEAARITEQTRFGVSPLVETAVDEARCPLGHVRGLNQLSGLVIDRDSWNGSDIALTDGWVGVRRGVLQPTRLLIASPRALHWFSERRMVGGEFEPAVFSEEA